MREIARSMEGEREIVLKKNWVIGIAANLLSESSNNRSTKKKDSKQKKTAKMKWKLFDSRGRRWTSCKNGRRSDKGVVLYIHTYTGWTTSKSTTSSFLLFPSFFPIPIPVLSRFLSFSLLSLLLLPLTEALFCNLTKHFSAHGILCPFESWSTYNMGIREKESIHVWPHLATCNPARCIPLAKQRWIVGVGDWWANLSFGKPTVTVRAYWGFSVSLLLPVDTLSSSRFSSISSWISSIRYYVLPTLPTLWLSPRKKSTIARIGREFEGDDTFRNGEQGFSWRVMVGLMR